MSRLCWRAGERWPKAWPLLGYPSSALRPPAPHLLPKRHLVTTAAHDQKDGQDQSHSISHQETSPALDDILDVVPVPKTDRKPQRPQGHEKRSSRRPYQASLEKQLYSLWDKHPSNTFRLLSKAIQRHGHSLTPMPVSPIMYISALKAAAQYGHLTIVQTILLEAKDARCCTMMTYHNILHTFAKTGNTGLAWCIKREMEKDGLMIGDRQRALLIIGYLKDRNVEQALDEWLISRRLQQTLPSVVWTRLIHALCQVYEGKTAMEVALAAENSGLSLDPSEISYGSLSVWEWILHASVYGHHLRGINYAFRRLIKMKGWPGIDQELGTRMLGLLGDWGASGLAEEAFHLLRLRPSLRIDPVLWGLLIRSHITARRHSMVMRLLTRFMEDEERWIPHVDVSPEEQERSDVEAWKAGYETMIHVAFFLPLHKVDMILPAQKHFMQEVTALRGSPAYTEKVQYLHRAIAANMSNSKKMKFTVFEQALADSMMIAHIQGYSPNSGIHP
ncbi:hypothetical protein BJ684DRAFT_15140 [Piptocephalis cylindrospora]|uniref:Pentatricopeptide repeat protein n=1 Tax=Piptocephalis cylindrospora TaxID=1907219 RepID=A0A4P9Y896_9FUNG|nr:hypothetical protein BJ684DRAFT_15140 [Piptocephalis cylindrospora]|eukprot:RKP14541.1 hypothetical protein BJ684DRAFT_15140 [Piptocephalis cylindrospora]